MPKGIKGFQKGVNRKGENNGMYGKKRKCPWVSERNKKIKSFLGHKHTKETKEINRQKHLNLPIERRNKLREIRQQQILKNGGGLNIGKNEKEALDELEKLFKIKIIRQFPVSGYFIDGYCKERNMVFEVYEKFHERQRTKDKKREDFIINKLKCKFIRIRDY